MVSSAAIFGRLVTCCKTSRWRSGAMLARKTNFDLRYFSGSFGLKLAKTLSSVVSVVRSLRFSEYFPAQKNVLPGACSSPSTSILRPLKTLASFSVKSSPTIPTRCTGVKKLAATEKYVAAPPSVRSTFPYGLSTPSNATEPTTSKDTLFSSLSVESLLKVLADDRRQFLFGFRRNHFGIGENRVS